MKAILITTHDEISIVNLDTSKPLYKAIGEVIGCDWIEVVHPMGLVEPYCMIADEEGGLKERQYINYAGSLLYGSPVHGQLIVGNIVIMKDVMTNEGPDIGGLDDEELPQMFKSLKNKFNLKEARHG